MSRHAVQTTLFVIMEASWIGALTLFVDAARGPTNDLTVLLVVSFYPLGMAAEQLIGRARLTGWHRGAARWGAYAALFVLAALLVFPQGPRPWDVQGLGWLGKDDRTYRLIAFAAIALFCWLRGAAVQGRQVTAQAIAVGLQIGLVMMMAVLALSQGVGVEWPGVPVAIVAFMLSGLLSMWYQRAGMRADGSSLRNHAAVVFGLGLVAALSFALVTAFDRAILDQVVGFVAWILSVIGGMLTFVLELMPRPDPASLDEPNGLEVEVMSDDPFPFQLPQDWRPIFGAALFSSFGIGIAMILFTNLRLLVAWLRKPRDTTPGLAIGRSGRGFGDTLAAIWAGLRALAGRLAARLGLGRAPAAGIDPVRRAYVEAERLLTRKGWPRHPSETPYEYSRRLRTAWAEGGDDHQTLTDSYVAHRYGAALTRPEEGLREQLARIRQSIRKMRNPNEDAPDAGRLAD